jgi:hypothetical protein
MLIFLTNGASLSVTDSFALFPSIIEYKAMLLRSVGIQFIGFLALKMHQDIPNQPQVSPS